MNRLKGEIVHIKSSSHISTVDVDINGDIFSLIIMETPESCDFLQIRRKVSIIFKETEVPVAKGLTGMISLRNRIKSPITSIEKGDVLGKVVFNYKGTNITSIITTRSVERMNLTVGEEAEWLVKATEILIMDEQRD